jgi:hypothetical protein
MFYKISFPGVGEKQWCFYCFCPYEQEQGHSGEGASEFIAFEAFKLSFFNFTDKNVHFSPHIAKIHVIYQFFTVFFMIFGQIFIEGGDVGYFPSAVPGYIMGTLCPPPPLTTAKRSTPPNIEFDQNSQNRGAKPLTPLWGKILVRNSTAIFLFLPRNRITIMSWIINYWIIIVFLLFSSSSNHYSVIHY